MNRKTFLTSLLALFTAPFIVKSKEQELSKKPLKLYCWDGDTNGFKMKDMYVCDDGPIMTKKDQAIIRSIVAEELKKALTITVSDIKPRQKIDDSQLLIEVTKSMSTGQIIRES